MLRMTGSRVARYRFAATRLPRRAAVRQHSQAVAAQAPKLTRNPNLDIPSGLAGTERLAHLVDRRGVQADESLHGPRPSWWWTGAPPEACAGWQPERGALTSLPQPQPGSCTRQEVLDYFDNTWTLTELLFASLQGDAAFYAPPYHQLRHPLIFYYGHVATLYINKLRMAGLVAQPINPLFESVFETGVDEMSWDDLSQAETSWPLVREVHEYRQKVYTEVRALIETHADLADGTPIGTEHPLWALFMGFEHERIHLETSSVLMRELPISLLRRPEGWHSIA